MRTAVVFPDTEFTDFTNMDIISIGAVTEHGDHQFYREVSDHREWLRSGFVQQHVMCFTDMAKFGAPKKQVAAEWAAWLDSLPGEDVLLVVDYVGDYQLIYDLHQIVQPKKRIDRIMYNQYLGNRLVAVIGKDTVEDYLDCWNDCCAIMEQEFKKEGVRQHHALDDAKVNRLAFKQSLYNAGNKR